MKRERGDAFVVDDEVTETANIMPKEEVTVNKLRKNKTTND